MELMLVNVDELKYIEEPERKEVLVYNGYLKLFFVVGVQFILNYFDSFRTKCLMYDYKIFALWSVVL